MNNILKNMSENTLLNSDSKYLLLKVVQFHFELDFAKG